MNPSHSFKTLASGMLAEAAETSWLDLHDQETSMNNPKRWVLPNASGWPDDPLPLIEALDDPQPFPMCALPDVLANYGEVIQRAIQAPDAIVGNSLLAAASLAVQPYANVVLPHGQSSPLSLYVVSVAESGERKSAVDRLALHAHATFEKARSDDQRAAIEQRKRLPKAEMERAEMPRESIFLASDPTIEGLVKLLREGLPSIGVFSAEGGRFFGGHGMSDETVLRTAAGLSLLWDGAPVDRVRAGDGASKLYGRRVALHMMAQPKAALQWLANPTLRDQGLFSRCLVAYPASTAGTRMFHPEKPSESAAAAAYVTRMTVLLDGKWPINEFHELQPHQMGIGGAARGLWINQHDQIEAAIARELQPIRGFASKAPENLARIAAIFTLVSDPSATSVTEDAMQRAAILMEFYINEGLRLAGARPQHEQSERAATLWAWFKQRGKHHVTLTELTQYGPNQLRKVATVRALMQVLEGHYYVRPMAPDTVEFGGKPRREAWEIRL